MMDTLKNDLERAIPHFDADRDGMSGIVSEGKQALRRRRARVAGACTTTGLAVAGVAMGVSAMFANEGRPNGGDATAGGQAPTPSIGSSLRPVEANLSLASMQQVANACGDLALDTSDKTLTDDGQAVAASDEATGDGWSAAQYACGSDVIRVVQVKDRALVGRYPSGDDKPLKSWAEDNVPRLQQ